MSKKVYLYPSLGGGYSMNRYLQGVISGLKQRQIEFEIVNPNGGGAFAKYFRYPLMAFSRRKQGGKHLIISERYAYLAWFMSKQSIVVCHDLHTLYVEAKVPEIHQRLYRFFLRSMYRAAKVVCVSESTREALISYCPRFGKHRNVVVLHNALEDFWTDSLKATPSNSGLTTLFNKHRILLSVGTDAWYKKNEWTLRTLARLDDRFHLLRVGAFNEQNRDLIEQLNVSHRITEVSDLTDDDLKYAYQNAEALMFPSTSEGFGWPVFEAIFSGCTVVCNYIKPLSELVLDRNGIIELDEAEVNLSRSHLPKASAEVESWGNHVPVLLSLN